MSDFLTYTYDIRYSDGIIKKSHYSSMQDYRTEMVEEQSLQTQPILQVLIKKYQEKDNVLLLLLFQVYFLKIC